MLRPFFSALLLLGFFSANTQPPARFQVSLEPVLVTGFPGIQSYTWALDQGKILVVGGTRDGLHRRQPFASFLPRYNNTELMVLDPAAGKVWKQSVEALPAPVAEQLQSSNMQFWQQGNLLVLTGGYGYSATSRDHITHPALTVIRVKETIEAIMAGKPVAPFIRQVTDERMAITGGKMLALNGRYFLLAGQRFSGRYNPHGPDHGPGFRQEYSNQVRSFTLRFPDEKPAIQDYKAWTDTALFHRRDLNALPQREPGGIKLTIFSGVFQPQEDIPYTNLVDVYEDRYAEVKDFRQQFSHYHCASLPAWSESRKTMYTFFFGGIAQKFIDTTGTMITDNDVPFVKTISVVERGPSGVREYALPETMPGYFGASAEFIPIAEKWLGEAGILDLDKLGRTTRTIGYIIGGIDSRAPHVFWNNDAERSRASPVIWKVTLEVK